MVKKGEDAQGPEAQGKGGRGRRWRLDDRRPRRRRETENVSTKTPKSTNKLVIKKLHEIVAARGKKRTDRKEQIELLSELYTISEENKLGVGILVKIKFAIVSAIFDYNPKISEAMKPEYWDQCMPAVKELLQMILDEKDTLITGENI